MGDNIGTSDNMQLASPVVIAAIAVTLTVAVPAPQDVPDSSEVELIEPFNSGASDGPGKPVVVVVRPTSFGEVFAGFPGFGGAEDVPRPHQVSLDDLFGGDHEEPLQPSSNNCGLLCKVFKTLEGSLGVFDDVWVESEAQSKTIMVVMIVMTIILLLTVKRFFQMDLF